MTPKHEALADGPPVSTRTRETFPPKWLLVVAILAVVAGLSWANFRITSAESGLSQQAQEAADFAKSVSEACEQGRVVFQGEGRLCTEAKDKADDPAPADGLEALRGEKGDPGLQGLPGQKGDKGDKGDRGDQGLLGPVAPPAAPVPGQDGQPGIPGKDGLNGADGAPGRDGVDGQPGTPGQDGAPGPAGPAPTKITFSNGTTCTPTAPGSTEYSCDGPPPGGNTNNSLIP